MRGDCDSIMRWSFSNPSVGGTSKQSHRCHSFLTARCFAAYVAHSDPLCVGLLQRPSVATHSAQQRRRPHPVSISPTQAPATPDTESATHTTHPPTTSPPAAD